MMLDLFKNLFKKSPEVDYQELKKAGALIVDVRSPGEFSAGHIKGAVNIPVNTLASHLPKVPKTKPIITCCASGMRSASAKQILMNSGFENVYNGGPWTVLNHKLG
jgi:rhodanese-related sulfurtransferase